MIERTYFNGEVVFKDGDVVIVTIPGAALTHMIKKDPALARTYVELLLMQCLGRELTEDELERLT